MSTSIRNFEIATKYQEGGTMDILAKDYGVSKQRIQQIVYKVLGKEVVRDIIHMRSVALYIKKEESVDPEKKLKVAYRRLVNVGLRWSVYANACLGCNRDDVEHNRYGYCAKCAYKYLPGVKEARKRATNEYNKKNPEKKRARDLRNTIAFYNRLKADPEKMAAFKQRQDEYYGGSEARKEYCRIKGREKYERIKELRIVEAEIRKEFPEYSHPFLAEYRKKALDKYHRNKLKKQSCKAIKSK